MTQKKSLSFICTYLFIFTINCFSSNEKPSIPFVTAVITKIANITYNPIIDNLLAQDSPCFNKEYFYVQFKEAWYLAEDLGPDHKFSLFPLELDSNQKIEMIEYYPTYSKWYRLICLKSDIAQINNTAQLNTKQNNKPQIFNQPKNITLPNQFYYNDQFQASPHNSNTTVAAIISQRSSISSLDPLAQGKNNENKT